MVGAKFFLQQFGRIGFEGRIFAPMLPVVGLEAGLDAHRGDVAVRATVCAVAGGRQGMREASFL